MVEVREKNKQTKKRVMSFVTYKMEFEMTFWNHYNREEYSSRLIQRPWQHVVKSLHGVNAMLVFKVTGSFN